MNRLASTLTTIAISAVFSFSHSASGADASLEGLKSRMQSLESRLEAIEQALQQRTGAHSYDDQATLDATNGNATTNTGGRVDGRGSETKQKTYVIRDGDTLGSIARKHGVKRAELLDANRLSEGQPIYIGETLLIPGQGTATAQQSEEKSQPTKPNAGNTARTQKPAPAKQEQVVVGETRKDADGRTHTVAKGDTLTSISKEYGTTVAKLRQANDLRGDVIELGQKLTIPTGGSAGMASSGARSNGKPNQEAEYEYDNPRLSNDETYGYYTVRKGDNLYALARDFFTTMAELQHLNEMGDSTLIYPGDELIVPTSEYNAYHNSGAQKNGGVAQR